MPEKSETESGKRQTTSDRIIASGIAKRMLDTIKKGRGVQDPTITFGIKDCYFSVVKTEDPQTEREHTQVIIEMPNLHPEYKKEYPRITQAFGVEEGKSFGRASDKPLTKEQFDLVQELVSHPS